MATVTVVSVNTRTSYNETTGEQTPTTTLIYVKPDGKQVTLTRRADSALATKMQQFKAGYLINAKWKKEGTNFILEDLVAATAGQGTGITGGFKPKQSNTEEIQIGRAMNIASAMIVAGQTQTKDLVTEAWLVLMAETVLTAKYKKYKTDSNGVSANTQPPLAQPLQNFSDNLGHIPY